MAQAKTALDTNYGSSDEFVYQNCGTADTRQKQVEHYFCKGNFEDAVIKAATVAEQAAKSGKPHTLIDSLQQIAAAQAALGDYQAAEVNLKRALTVSRELNDRLSTASILGALGNIYIATGPPAKAEQYLNQALNQIEDGEAPKIKAVILNNLANHYAFQGQFQRAQVLFQESITLSKRAGNTILITRSLANEARVALQLGNTDKAIALVNEAASLTQPMENSRSKIFLLVNLGRTLGDAEHRDPRLAAIAHRLLTQANAVSAAIGSSEGASYALGYLGELYEAASRHDESLTLTNKALFQAQQSDAKYLLFLWHWQAARQYRALGDKTAAIKAYQEAVRLLQKVRYQMSVAYRPKDASFRESLGAVYFQFVDLLLQKADETNDPLRSAEILRQIRDTVELLKVAELRNYFDDECIDALQAREKKVEMVSHSAVVIYPILLDDRLEILLSFPTGKINRYSVPVGLKQLVQEVRKYRRLLEKRTTYEYRKPAQQLFQWLVEPYQADLEDTKIDTLVFVPSGALLTIPMAALFDGKQHLIAKFALVTTPGIELTDPQPLDMDEARAVWAGLSQSVAGFPALEYVSGELKNIRQLYGGELLLNENFMNSRLKTALIDPKLNVLHISTHAQFSSNLENSYLLTYDGRLTINQLAELVGLFKFRETPLELLVLSACETAQGDDRAALGLSGIAIKAGARSAVGTLWKVNDAATSQLITEFYTQLGQPDISRAMALRRAQLKLHEDIRYRHPSYWSAFILMNSWL